MAFAQFVANSGLLSSSAATTLNAPAARASGDLLTLLRESANEALSWDADFAELSPPGQQGIGTAASTTATRAGVATRVADGTTTDNASCADPGDHQIGIMTAWRDVPASPHGMTPYGGTLAGASSSFTIPGGTTTWSDCLIVLFITTNLDRSDPILTSVTNGDLANIATRFDDGGLAGNGGTVGVVSGEKATAGAFGDTSLSLQSAADNLAYIVVALKSSTSVEGGGGGGGGTPMHHYRRRRGLYLRRPPAGYREHESGLFVMERAA